MKTIGAFFATPDVACWDWTSSLRPTDGMGKNDVCTDADAWTTGTRDDDDRRGTLPRAEPRRGAVAGPAGANERLIIAASLMAPASIVIHGCEGRRVRVWCIEMTKIEEFVFVFTPANYVITTAVDTLTPRSDQTRTPRAPPAPPPRARPRLPRRPCRSPRAPKSWSRRRTRCPPRGWYP